MVSMRGLEFYKGKRVFVTGHTGFKGSWMSRLLILAGADVTGYSLDPPTEPSLFGILGLKNEMHSIHGDVRDVECLKRAVRENRPEIVFHLAAQPLVRESYRFPRETFETNIMGTVNLLEALRSTGSASSIVNVTTDKVYLNREQRIGYREEDMLDGYDPYSNSKSCSDIVTHSYRESFFREMGTAVSCARAGNVIGGGDFAKDRIVPDCVRAAACGQTIVLRNPGSVRPFQHVLEPVSAYLKIAEKQAQDPSLAGEYNVGPDESDAVTAGELADLFTEAWGEGSSWRSESDGGPHEAGLLLLDSGKISRVLGWKPKWTIRDAVSRTVEWSKVYMSGGDAEGCTDEQIREYCNV